jgi:chaperone LolA
MFGLVFALLLLLPQRLGVDDLVDKVSYTYGRLDNFEADFEQITRDFSNQTSRQRGHVYLKSGKRARFDYLFPEEKQEYFDGKTRTIYIPAPISQARQMPITKDNDERLTIFQIVGNRESPWKDQFKEKRDLLEPPVVQQGNRVVRLIPKNKDLSEVIIEVDPSRFLIDRLAFTYMDGQRSEFIFRNIKTTKLDDSLFKFTAPPGVEVVKEK